MTYAKKLIAAKIFVSAGLCIYVLMSFAVDYGVLYGNLMALPIMLWAVWGKKLHGTGRSVRLMAFLGLAFAMGLFLATASQVRRGAELHDPVFEKLTMGMDGNLVATSVVFILLLSGIFLSIRRP